MRDKMKTWGYEFMTLHPSRPPCRCPRAGRRAASQPAFGEIARLHGAELKHMICV